MWGKMEGKTLESSKRKIFWKCFYQMSKEYVTLHAFLKNVSMWKEGWAVSFCITSNSWTLQEFYFLKPESEYCVLSGWPASTTILSLLFRLCECLKLPTIQGINNVQSWRVTDREDLMKTTREMGRQQISKKHYISRAKFHKIYSVL